MLKVVKKNTIQVEIGGMPILGPIVIACVHGRYFMVAYCTLRAFSTLRPRQPRGLRHTEAKIQR